MNESSSANFTDFKSCSNELCTEVFTSDTHLLLHFICKHPIEYFKITQLPLDRCLETLPCLKGSILEEKFRNLEKDKTITNTNSNTLNVVTLSETNENAESVGSSPCGGELSTLSSVATTEPLITETTDTSDSDLLKFCCERIGLDKNDDVGSSSSDFPNSPVTPPPCQQATLFDLDHSLNTPPVAQQSNNNGQYANSLQQHVSADVLPLGINNGNVQPMYTNLQPPGYWTSPSAPANQQQQLSVGGCGQQQSDPPSMPILTQLMALPPRLPQPGHQYVTNGHHVPPPNGQQPAYGNCMQQQNFGQQQHHMFLQHQQPPLPRQQQFVPQQHQSFPPQQHSYPQHQALPQQQLPYQQPLPPLQQQQQRMVHQQYTTPVQSPQQHYYYSPSSTTTNYANFGHPHVAASPTHPAPSTVRPQMAPANDPSQRSPRVRQHRPRMQRPKFNPNDVPPVGDLNSSPQFVNNKRSAAEAAPAFDMKRQKIDLMVANEKMDLSYGAKPKLRSEPVVRCMGKCKKKFKSAEELFEHEIKDYGTDRRYPCPIASCKWASSTAIALTNHILALHPGITGTVHCPWCQVIFSRISEYTDHVMDDYRKLRLELLRFTFYEEWSITCKRCKALFKSKESWLEHRGSRCYCNEPESSWNLQESARLKEENNSKLRRGGCKVHERTVCSTFPCCTLVNCPSIHPLCKSGISCTNQSCPYDHPVIVKPCYVCR